MANAAVRLIRPHIRIGTLHSAEVCPRYPRQGRAVPWILTRPARRKRSRRRNRATRTVPPISPPHYLSLMNIEITPKKTDGLERLIEVRVPIEAVRAAEEQAAKRYATSVRLPGFRPGKAPPAMIKKRFKDAIRQQVVESLVQEAFK